MIRLLRLTTCFHMERMWPAEVVFYFFGKSNLIGCEEIIFYFDWPGSWGVQIDAQSPNLHLICSSNGDFISIDKAPHNKRTFCASHASSSISRLPAILYLVHEDKRWFITVLHSTHDMVDLQVIYCMVFTRDLAQPSRRAAFGLSKITCENHAISIT